MEQFNYYYRVRMYHIFIIYITFYNVKINATHLSFSYEY